MELPRIWEKPNNYIYDLISNPWFSILAEFYNIIHFSSTEFFHKKNIGALMLPVTTHSISSPVGLGSDSEPVSVNLFGRDIFLADSMQFLLELGVRLCPDYFGVWYTMPSFRGEESDARHLSEFIHLEAEIRGGLNEVISLVNDLISHLAASVISEKADDVIKLAGTVKHLEKIANMQFPEEINYNEAIKLLENVPEGLRYHEAGFVDITSEGEKALIKHFAGPIWITRHPTLRAPFYQRNDESTESALCADLLMGIGETVGSGARQITGEDVISALSCRRIDPSPYNWYVEMKRHFPIPTAGFGMGLERFIAWITGLDDIRYMQFVVRQKGIFAIP